MIGSFNGQVTPGTNMIDVFRNDNRLRMRSFPHATSFHLLHLAINAKAGTTFNLDGAQIVTPTTGIFEVCGEMTPLESLVFSEAATVNIIYYF